MLEKQKDGNNKTIKIYRFNGDNGPVSRVKLLNQWYVNESSKMLSSKYIWYNNDEN